MEKVEKALKLKSELDKLRPIDKEREAVIMQKLRLDWNYHSNNLEGNSLTYGETKALLLFGITAQGKPLKDHFEITGHDEAIKWVMDILHGDYPLTENFIRELHVLLLKESYVKDAISPEGKSVKRRIEVGKYKSSPNHVLTQTGEIFRFAEPEETPALMHDLIERYRQKRSQPGINPIILAAEFHYRFIRIHPFDDGNGRTARIIMNFILMSYGYPPVIIKTQDKQNYFSFLRQADSGIIEPFIEYIAGNLVRSLEIMIAGAKGENIEEPDDLDKEIALLEQKLRTVGKKIEIVRTKESILEVYDNSIARLSQVYIEACRKFDKFYIGHFFYFNVNGGHRNGDNTHFIQLHRDLITHNTAHVDLIYNYSTFNVHGFGEFNYRSDITFQFGLSSYKVLGFEKMIEKVYGDQLSNEEIDEIVRSVTKRHKDYIELVMSEVKRKPK